ncbi:PBSX family phage terminase large subunit [Glutamicibacter ardleyensis]|uniref:Phage terminase large subunit n=1 Tax=Glutamicibacter ardleyensis TaxID=225894 RepID=A0ABQ2DFT2_9MICC|nr:phage terminase large subunit [Glutamicibacter ardleyensis]GGJ55740.1 phage terminase large subunit [Glutamicibacter ardleyensis]
MANVMSDRQITAVANAEGRVNIYEGAIRSGKTFASILRWLAFVITAPPNGQLIMIGKNKDSIFRNVFEPIESEPALNMVAQHVHYRQGSPTARIFGRRVHVVGANDQKAESKIRGMTVGGAYVDEVTVLPVEFFKQLLGRMSVDGAKLFGTTNPDSPSHWLKTEYLDKIDHPDPEVKLIGWKRFHFTIDDNPSLSDDYKNSLRREYTGLWFRRFILGLWVSAEGAIYDMWDAAQFNRDRPKDGGHLVQWEDLPEMEDLLCVGLDYGTTNPTSAILLGMGIDGRLYAIDEYRHVSKDGEIRLTDKQLSERLISWIGKKHLPDSTPERPRDDGFLEPRFLIIDPSAASLQTQLLVDGVTNVEHAENDVTYGIRKVASLMSQKLLLVSSLCHGLISELPGYSWDPDEQLKGRDKPLKTADHSCDAIRYAVATTEQMWARRVNYRVAA